MMGPKSMELPNPSRAQEASNMPMELDIEANSEANV